MPSGVLFPGFALTGFRSFGTQELQLIGPMSKVHLLAGPNNSGKSNVLRAVERVFPVLHGEAELEFTSVDAPLVPEEIEHAEFRISIPRRVGDSDFEIATGAAQALRQLLSGPSFGPDDELLWFEFRWTGSGWETTERQLADVTDAGTRPSGAGTRIIDPLAQRLSSVQGGGIGADAGRIMTRLVSAWNVKEGVPRVASIGAFRQVTGGAQDYNGRGLIERLQQLQNPNFERREDVKRFARINQFVQTVFEEDAAIEIPYDRETILVHYGSVSRSRTSVLAFTRS